MRGAEYERAIERMSEARIHYRTLGDRRSIAYMDFWIGSCQNWLWPSIEARHLMEHSLAEFRALGDPNAESWAVYGLGMAHLFRGDFGEAHDKLLEASEICEELGVLDRAAGDITYVGLTLMHQGEHELALAKATKALKRARDSELSNLIGSSLHVIGSIELVQGQYEEARRILAETTGIMREIGWHDELCWVSALLCMALTLGWQDPPCKTDLVGKP